MLVVSEVDRGQVDKATRGQVDKAKRLCRQFMKSGFRKASRKAARKAVKKAVKKAANRVFLRVSSWYWTFNVIKLRPDRFPEVAFQAGFGLIRCGCMLKSDPDNLSGLG